MTNKSPDSNETLNVPLHLNNRIIEYFQEQSKKEDTDFKILIQNYLEQYASSNSK